jgi:hypothetical protein
MVAIVGCESGYVHYKKDGSVLRGRVDGSDSGVAQINQRYHPDADTDSLWGNLAYARELFDAEGTTPWVCKNHITRR